MRKPQQGMTLIGFIFVLLIAGFFALMAMKLVPSYIEYFGVVKAMKQMAVEPGAAHMSLRDIRSDLAFKGNFQYVDDDTLDGNAVRVERTETGKNLVVEYDKTIHFIYNISFLLHFEKTVALSGRAA